MTGQSAPLTPPTSRVDSPEFAARLENAASADHLLVATDFDGTIAPFMDDPQAVVPLPGSVDALTTLAKLPDVTAALVSGRDLETLGRLAGHPLDVTLIGSHGAQSTDAEVAGPGTLSTEQSDLLARISHAAELLAKRYEGLMVEHKSAAVGIHVRQVEPGLRKAAMGEAERMIREQFGVEPMLGKNVVEAAVLRSSKGRALTALADKVGADAVVYFGDDVTDETVFTTFAGHPSALMVKIGLGDTAGGVRLSGPADAAAALVRLRELRQGAASAG